MSAYLRTILLSTFLLPVAFAQSTTPGQTPTSSTPAVTPAPAAPTPLSTPAITGPLSGAPPITIDGGPFGKLQLDGVVSGLGLWQSNHLPGDKPTQATLSNGQIFLQKTDGWFQFYIEAGAYDLPILGVPFLNAGDTTTNAFGPVPVAYVKLVPGKNTSIEVGALPTLMGAEGIFTFQNMNVERGLLWNQENVVNRGIQVNQAMGKFTAAVSWNDGYYSSRYTWLSGSLTYTNGRHSLIFDAMGNLGQTKYQTFDTPVQNNGSMYALIYTYTKGSWIIQPYYQYGDVPTNKGIGITQGAHAQGGAILINHTFAHGFSLPGRFEYLTTSGGANNSAVNLLYGPGSAATSFTLTPTFQYSRFFVRGDLSWVHAISSTPGYVFGSTGSNVNQPRAEGEIGFLF